MEQSYLWRNTLTRWKQVLVDLGKGSGWSTGAFSHDGTVQEKRSVCKCTLRHDRDNICIISATLTRAVSILSCDS